MIINSPEVRKTLEDYDFVTTTGLMMVHTIDKAAGDTIDFHDSIIRIHLTSKKGLAEDSKTQEEEILIFKDHLISISHRTREVVEDDPEVKHAYAMTIQEMSKTKH
jgi:hypothetical protein